MDTITIKRNGDFAKKALNTIKGSNTKLEVGFFNPEVASYATTNEYGEVINGVVIPARPFMQQTVDKNKKKWMEIFPKLVNKYQGNINNIFNALGVIIQDDIRVTIVDGDFVPNAPYTVKLKGKNSPLRDTLRMYDSIEWEVIK